MQHFVMTAFDGDAGDAADNGDNCPSSSSSSSSITISQLLQDNNAQQSEHAKLCRLQDTVELVKKETMYWMVSIVTFYCNLLLI